MTIRLNKYSATLDTCAKLIYNFSTSVKMGVYYEHI